MNFDWKYCSDVMETDFYFHKLLTLRHYSTVDLYQKQFELLQHLVLAHYPHLDDAYFMSCCVQGFKDELQPTVLSFLPASLDTIFSIARLKESSLSAINEESIPNQESKWGSLSEQSRDIVDSPASYTDEANLASVVVVAPIVAQLSLIGSSVHPVTIAVSNKKENGFANDDLLTWCADERAVTCIAFIPKAVILIDHIKPVVAANMSVDAVKPLSSIFSDKFVDDNMCITFIYIVVLDDSSFTLNGCFISFEFTNVLNDLEFSKLQFQETVALTAEYCVTLTAADLVLCRIEMVRWHFANSLTGISSVRLLYDPGVVWAAVMLFLVRTRCFIAGFFGLSSQSIQLLQSFLLANWTLWTSFSVWDPCIQN